MRYEIGYVDMSRFADQSIHRSEVYTDSHLHIQTVEIKSRS
jgi:hypothetical protein